MGYPPRTIDVHAPPPRANRRGGRHQPSPMPFPLSNQDRLRLKLREKARGLSSQVAGMTKLPTLPGVQSFSAAIRFIEGGRARVIELMQRAVLNREPVAERWWEVYAELTAYERSIVSFDDVCAAAGVTPSKLGAAIVSTAMEEGQQMGNLVAALTHPILVHQAAKSAKRIGGQYAEISYKDRQRLLEAQGLVPIPKGREIHVHAHATSNATAAAAAASADPSVPSFSDDMAALAAPRQGVQRQLIAAHAREELVFDAQVVERETVPGAAQVAQPGEPVKQ